MKLKWMKTPKEDTYAIYSDRPDPDGVKWPLAIIELAPLGLGKDDIEQLFRAAPELLQRLKQARNAIASLPDEALDLAGSDRYQWPIKAEFLNYVDDAIARAEGER